MIDAVALGVFAFFFALVTVLGFIASRWNAADLGTLNEWGLGGRRFGTLISWFLIGGDLYTAYTFIAVPALMYGAGALAFFAVPYTIWIYPMALLVLPRLWTVCHRRQYVTPADYVYGRHGSRALEAAVAVTGILATMPYIALQLVGIQVVLAGMGVKGDLPLVVAFLILAAYTYTSGLRAPAMIAFVKDTMIYITVIVAIVVIPMHLGGYGNIFATAGAALQTHVPKPGMLIMSHAGFPAYITLAFGSALALFLYPHSVTGVLASKNQDTIRRNMALLPAYSLLLGFLALLGLMALAAGVITKVPSLSVPLLIVKMFPSWFVGFAFAAIGIGALVPAAIMSIAASNLFTRNIWLRYVQQNATPAQEAGIAKTVSLIVKIGALAFVVFLPLSYAIQLQLLGGVWIMQTLPAIVIGLYTRWQHPRALFLGWLVGMVLGTWMAWSQGFSSIFPLHVGGAVWPAYAGLYAFVANLIVTAVFTWIFDAMRMPRHADQTVDSDYEETAVSGAPLPTPA